MNLKIELKECKHGKGLFATETIQEGELIFFVNGRIVTYEEGLRLPCGGDHSVQIGPDLYVDPQYPSKYINHSCEPNAGIRDDLSVVAIRRIEPGDEVTFDYSTCILERAFRLKCECGEANCRGWIGDFDELSEETKLKYIRLGVVQPFIMDHHFQIRRRSAIEAEYSKEYKSRKPVEPPVAPPAPTAPRDSAPLALQPLA